MNTKLTLRMDENLIAQAKLYAAKEGRSLSDLVGSYFARLAEAKKSVDAKADPSTTALSGAAAPRFSSFYGLMAGSPLDESDYYAHLEQKHK
jgi:Family of unknown function (DUF6364)